MISQNKTETELQIQRTNRWLPEGRELGEERKQGRRLRGRTSSCQTVTGVRHREGRQPGSRGPCVWHQATSLPSAINCEMYRNGEPLRCIPGADTVFVIGQFYSKNKLTHSVGLTETRGRGMGLENRMKTVKKRINSQLQDK